MRMSACRALTLAAFATGVAALSSSCASAPKKEEPIQTVEEYERNTPPPDDPCYENGGEPRECDGPEDCCKGFACSLDPARSRVRKFCLEG